MKLFVASDIHSYYEPFIKALNEAGFDQNNEEHWLIICGDCFDRGPDSKKLLHYLMSLERKILVKGNHDLLLDECCAREFPYSYDITNGTVKTILDIGGGIHGNISFDECCCRAYNKLAAYRGLLVNYFETEHYIFVHSWIPLNPKGFYNKFVYREDWREATDQEWAKAMWGNPFFNAHDGLNETGKTIVFGHWHCSFGHAMDNGFDTDEFSESAIWDIYRNDDWKVIGIDKCTAHTGEVNVLVLEDNFITN